MAEARDRVAWCHTMAVLAQLYNVNRTKNDPPINPMDFFPWTRDDRPAPRRLTEGERLWLRHRYGPKTEG